MKKTFSLPQSERINSKKQIDRLFRGGGSKAMTASPLRMVYMAGERGEDERGPVAQMMVSVPKRYFKRAVKRNLIKRQVREAYRLEKHIVAETLGREHTKTVAMCFIWTDARLRTAQEVQTKMHNLLVRLAERLGTAGKPQGESSDGNIAHNNYPILNAL